jgi:hypothetical protein
MGWFSENRRPFSDDFLERLDQLESQIAQAESLRQDDRSRVEIIPVEVVKAEVVSGVERLGWKELTTEPNDSGGRSSDDGSDDMEFASRPASGWDGVVVRHYVASDTSVSDGQGGQTTVALHKVRHSLVPTDRSFWARIEEQELLGSVNPIAPIWKYRITHVRREAAATWAAVSGGIANVWAYNSLESANTASPSMIGYGMPIEQVDVENEGPAFYLDCPSISETLQFLPVPVGTVVRVHSEIHETENGPITTWTFSAPNPLVGCVECAAEEEEPPP